MSKLVELDLEFDLTGPKGKELVEMYNGCGKIVDLNYKGRLTKKRIFYSFHYDPSNKKLIAKVTAPQENVERAKEFVRNSVEMRGYI